MQIYYIRIENKRDEINKKFGLKINVKRVNNIEAKFYNEGDEINE